MFTATNLTKVILKSGKNVQKGHVPYFWSFDSYLDMFRHENNVYGNQFNQTHS